MVPWQQRWLYMYCAAVAQAAVAAATLRTPPWNFTIERHGEVCTDASTSHAPQSENNTRWSYWALPPGPAPPAGYPIYVELQAEIMFPGDWRTPLAELPVCGNGWVPPPDGWYRPQYNIFDRPMDAMASCFRDDGSWRPLSFSGKDCETSADGHKACCTFFQKAGQLWLARLHQYLLANGIAILVVNPYAGDTWEWDDPNLPNGSGLDQPYFATLAAEIQSSKYGGLPAGTLDTARTIFSGFSDGAQMTSYMIELQARRALPTGLRIVAGVMLSGGSHRCYMTAGQGAVSNCAACTNAGSCGGGSGSRGCSVSASPLCCDYCCPSNYTEDWYAAHPGDYPQHPPVFLAQSSASDFNADLCAAKVYYETLRRHNVSAELALLPAAEQRCSCVGQQANGTNGTNGTDEADASPLERECDLIPPEPAGDRGNCVDHVCAFGAMVEPLTQFLLRVLRLPAS
jgi:hypothetical protein